MLLTRRSLVKVVGFSWKANPTMESISAPIQASIPFEQVLVGELGIVLIPSLIMDRLRAQGRLEYTITFATGATGAEPGWLTVSDAARLHLDDVAGLDLPQAKSRIHYACERGRIRSVGTGRDRRIDPVSLNAWRLAQRERDLDRADEDR